jgi:predicted ArsR family transcriptional regulator
MLNIENDTVAELAPSRKLVYLVLQEDGPLTQVDLIERCALHERTARDALDELVETGVVEKQPYLGGDARKSLYTARSRRIDP